MTSCGARRGASAQIASLTGQLVVQAYGPVGIVETACSFAMSYWYPGRAGISFTTQWFSFGNLPEDMGSGLLPATAGRCQLRLLGHARRHAMVQSAGRAHAPPVRVPARAAVFPAMAFALVMAFFWLYIPALQASLGAAQVSVEHWFLPMAFGPGLLSVDSGGEEVAQRRLGADGW